MMPLLMRHGRRADTSHSLASNPAGWSRKLLTALVFAWAVAAVATPGQSAELSGIRSSKNFVLSAPSKELTRAGLAQAEYFRKQIALEWLGHELPPGESFADITISLASEGEEDSGRLWLANRDSGRPHMMWLTGSRKDVLGGGMVHEVAHVVMAAQFPQGMPVWANEGIASSYDDAERSEIRQAIMQRIVRNAAWPSIDELLTAKQIAPGNQTAYALASSLTAFFVSLADRPTFIHFINQAQRAGWDAALESVYSIDGRSELQLRWHRWAANEVGDGARIASGSKSVVIPTSARTTR